MLTEFFKDKGLKKKSDDIKDNRFNSARGILFYLFIFCGCVCAMYPIYYKISFIFNNTLHAFRTIVAEMPIEVY